VPCQRCRGHLDSEPQGGFGNGSQPVEMVQAIPVLGPSSWGSAVLMTGLAVTGPRRVISRPRISGSGEYKFHIWSEDGNPDTFRTNIWTEEAGAETVAYDSRGDPRRVHAGISRRRRWLVTVTGAMGLFRLDYQRTLALRHDHGVGRFPRG
jgi:hypothetical protein